MAIVLIVGTKSIARGIAQAVQEMGHETRVLSSAEGAKRHLTQERIAVLIVELCIDGFPLLRLAKMYSRGTKVLFVAADASLSDYKRAIDEGALEVLVQPFSNSDLQAVLRRALTTSEGTKSIIHELTITDLLQLMHMGRRAVTIKVTPGEGRIHMAGGQIVHATHYGLTGRDALRSMLASDAATIVTAPATDVAQTIDGSFEMLLLDLMREIDERRRSEPSVDIVIEEAAPAPPEEQTKRVPSKASGELWTGLAVAGTDDVLPQLKDDRFATSFVIAMVLIAIVIGLSEALTWWT